VFLKMPGKKLRIKFQVNIELFENSYLR